MLTKNTPFTSTPTSPRPGYSEDKRLHALLEQTGTAVVLLDRQLHILYLSPPVEQILGYTELDGAHLAQRFDLLHPDDRHDGRHLLLAVLETPGERMTRELRVQHKEGTYRWIEATITNLLDDPETQAVLATLRDISDRKYLEEERQQLLQREQHARQAAELERQRVRSLFAQAPALLHILRGPEHIFEFFHPFGKELVGGRDLTGMKVREALPEYEGQGYFELLDHVYQTGETHRAQEMPSLLAAADGTLVERFFNFIFQRWYDVDGSVAGILNFAVEVTDQVRARQQVEALAAVLQQNQQRLEQTNSELQRQRNELACLNAELEVANQVRSQFVSTMTHELRTPLAVILGFSQILLKNPASSGLSQRQRDDLECILKNGRHLLALVNDVLDIAKIESGHLKVASSQVNLDTWLPSLVEEVQPLALQRHLTLRTDVEAGAHTLETDPVKLRQILLNLLSNALKFTEQGEVTVTARRVTSSKAENPRVEISVKDTGIGIPAELHEHLFEAFYQVEGGISRRFGGTGLGLAIVRQLATLLEGTVTVESAPGEGSTFTLTLPSQVAKRDLAEQHEQPLRLVALPRLLDPASRSTRGASDTPSDVSLQANAKGETRCTLLVVDDNADLLSLLTSLLEGTPYEARGVQDPEQVVDMARELQPCAITLDVMMPHRNGWQVLYQLKTTPATAHIPVIMLTILAEQTTGYVLGADAYLSKPFEREALLDTLCRVVEQRTVR